jgi:hypothetical protein
VGRIINVGPVTSRILLGKIQSALECVSDRAFVKMQQDLLTCGTARFDITQPVVVIYALVAPLLLLNLVCSRWNSRQLSLKRRAVLYSPPLNLSFFDTGADIVVVCRSRLISLEAQRYTTPNSSQVLKSS